MGPGDVGMRAGAGQEDDTGSLQSLRGVGGGGGGGWALWPTSYQCFSKMQMYELLLSYFSWSEEKSAVDIRT